MTPFGERRSQRYTVYRPENIPASRPEGRSHGVFSPRHFAEEVARVLIENLNEKAVVNGDEKSGYFVHWLLDKESQKDPRMAAQVMQWASNEARKKLGRPLFALEASLNQEPRTEINIFCPSKSLSRMFHATASLAVQFKRVGSEKPKFEFLPIPKAMRVKNAGPKQRRSPQ